MQFQAFAIWVQLLGLALAAKKVTIDCTNAPKTCNNDCYATFVAGRSGTLNYAGPRTAAEERAVRRRAGCTMSNGLSPCGDNGIPRYKAGGNTCDEYPPESATDGTNSILRCVPLSDNASEGSQLGNFYAKPIADGGCGSKPCSFMFGVNSATISGSPFCMTETGPNDGLEFRKNAAGDYVNARMKRRGTDSFEDDIPEAGSYVPLHKRREFLLDNGERFLLLSHDMDSDFNGTLVVSGETMEANFIVSELHGHEKSLPFRPL